MTVDEEYLGSEPLVGPKKPIWRSRFGLLSGGFIELLMTLMLKKMLWIIYTYQIWSQVILPSRSCSVSVFGLFSCRSCILYILACVSLSCRASGSQRPTYHKHVKVILPFPFLSPPTTPRHQEKNLFKPFFLRWKNSFQRLLSVQQISIQIRGSGWQQAERRGGRPRLLLLSCLQ